MNIHKILTTHKTAIAEELENARKQALAHKTTLRGEKYSVFFDLDELEPFTRLLQLNVCLCSNDGIITIYDFPTDRALLEKPSVDDVISYAVEYSGIE